MNVLSWSKKKKARWSIKDDKYIINFSKNYLVSFFLLFSLWKKFFEIHTIVNAFRGSKKLLKIHQHDKRRKVYRTKKTKDWIDEKLKTMNYSLPSPDLISKMTIENVQFLWSFNAVLWVSILLLLFLCPIFTIPCILNEKHS